MKELLKKGRLIALLMFVLFLGACEMQSQYSSTQDPSVQTVDMQVMKEEVASDTAVRQQSNRDVIYTASVNYQTIGYEAAKQSLVDIIEGADGFIQYQDESVNEYTYSDNNKTLTNLYMVIRVPQDNYESILEKFEANDQAQLMQLSRGSQDVTQQVHDISIRLESVDNRIERLNELNEQAESIADLIEIQTALEEAMTERDILLADQAAINDEIDYATINLSLQEVIELSDRSESQLTFLERVMMAFNDMLKNSVDALEWGVLSVIFLIPYIIVVLILILIISYIIRPLLSKLFGGLRRNKKSKAERKVGKVKTTEENNDNTDE